MTNNVSTHEQPSSLFIIGVIKKKYPHILQEAKELFIPLQYNFELMHKVKETTSSIFNYDSRCNFNTREIILGTIVLMYSRTPIDKTKRACLHSGVSRYACNVLGMLPPNISSNFDKVHLWLRINENFYEHCHYIRFMVTGSGN